MAYKNIEDERAQKKRWRDANPEKVKRYKKQDYQKHSKRIKKQLEKWRKDNPEKIKQVARKASIKRNHGLSYEDWLQLWENQDGKCAICGKFFITPSNAYVDHDHKTDEIRGLLCNKCNWGLGMYDDDPELLMSAIRYLKNK